MDTKKILYVLGVVLFLGLVSYLEIENIERNYKAETIHKDLGVVDDRR